MSRSSSTTRTRRGFMPIRPSAERDSFPARAHMEHRTGDVTHLSREVHAARDAECVFEDAQQKYRTSEIATRKIILRIDRSLRGTMVAIISRFARSIQGAYRENSIGSGTDARH